MYTKIKEEDDKWKKNDKVKMKRMRAVEKTMRVTEPRIALVPTWITLLKGIFDSFKEFCVYKCCY